MTDDERREVEELAQLISNDPHPVRDINKFTKQCIRLGYSAGRDSMREERDEFKDLYKNKQNQVMRFSQKLEAERVRSQKLIETLRSIAALDLPDEKLKSLGLDECAYDTMIARQAIAEYEASEQTGQKANDRR